MVIVSKFLTLLICLFFVSCGSRIDPSDDTGSWYKIEYKIYLDKDFTQSEIISIESAVSLWSRSTHGRITWKIYEFDKQVPPPSGRPIDYERLVPTQERVVIINKSYSYDDWIKQKDSQFDNKNTVTLGYFIGSPVNSHANIWLVSDRLTNDLARTIVAAHELGHSLDLWHVTDERSIMSALFNDNRCLTIHDLEAFCSKHFCDSAELDQSCVIE